MKGRGGRSNRRRENQGRDHEQEVWMLLLNTIFNFFYLGNSIGRKRRGIANVKGKEGRSDGERGARKGAIV